MSLESNYFTEIVKKRAFFFEKVRNYFLKKNIFEVDLPVLQKYPSIDENIDPMQTVSYNKKVRYLHTSPELFMKRLLSHIDINIYQMSHVFRKDEKGKLHNPEFTLIEWYKKEIDFFDFIKEVIELITIFTGKKNINFLSYKEAFLKLLKINPLTSSKKDLLDLIDKKSNCSASDWDKDTILQFLFSHYIEPKLKDLTVIYYYPETQAALAKKTIIDNEKVAKRFEIYFNNIELANGYDELIDADEQQKRFAEENNKRKKQKKETFDIDKDFILDLKNLNPCCGVAVGFDRLLMINLNKESIHDVMIYSEK